MRLAFNAVTAYGSLFALAAYAVPVAFSSPALRSWRTPAHDRLTARQHVSSSATMEPPACCVRQAVVGVGRARSCGRACGYEWAVPVYLLERESQGGVEAVSAVSTELSPVATVWLSCGFGRQRIVRRDQLLWTYATYSLAVTVADCSSVVPCRQHGVTNPCSHITAVAIHSATHMFVVVAIDEVEPKQKHCCTESYDRLC